MTNPLNHAPARLSDLHGDARTSALAARHRAATEAYMRTYRDRPVASRWGRFFRGLVG